MLQWRPPSAGREGRGLPAASSVENDPRTGLLLLTLPSSLVGYREEEWQWGRWGVPSWGFQRWRVWSCCHFREARGPENTSSPLCEPAGATVENWETARGRGKTLPWNSWLGGWGQGRGWRCQTERRRERNQTNATIPKMFLYQILTYKEATSVGQVAENNSLARLWPLDSKSITVCSMTVFWLKDLEREMCPVNFWCLTLSD